MARDLGNARKNKNDEFYTQYSDIQNEINAYVEYNPDVFKNKIILLPADDPEWSNFTKFFAQNFERFGLKKLISTSYAYDSKNIDEPYQLSFFEESSPKYDKRKTKSHGKIFVLDKDDNNSGRIDINDLKWEYLNGDGDFRSEEVRKLRDEADIIITNPPFSLFREFVNWIIEGGKKFIIIGHQNAISYKEIFPLIRDNKIWLGKGFTGGATHFINKYYNDYATASEHKEGMIRVSGVVWFTNLENIRRQQKLQLMTMADNLKYSKHKEIINEGYSKYENFDAIDVSFTDAIPSDYDGVMGVPITFLNKHNPLQFEILGFGAGELGVEAGVQPYDRSLKKMSSALRDGIPFIYNKEKNEIKVPYARIFIRKIMEEE